MLPFLKNNKEASASGPVEHVEFGKEEGGSEYGMLDAVAEDLLAAFEKKDVSMLKSALESLVEHIKSEDEIQDQETTGV